MKCKYCEGKASVFCLLYSLERICEYCYEARKRVEEEKERNGHHASEILFESEVKKRMEYFVW